MMYFYLGNSDYVYIALNKHSRILVYALILKDHKSINSIINGTKERKKRKRKTSQIRRIVYFTFRTVGRLLLLHTGTCSVLQIYLRLYLFLLEHISPLNGSKCLHFRS